MKRLILLTLAVLILFVHPVLGEVITTPKTEGYGDYIYVAGKPDNYPIEYYDNDTKSYRGIIPDLLGEISDRSGLNFVYINGGKANREELGTNLQVDIVSSTYIGATYAKDFVELISYEKDGKVDNCGIAFTAVASEQDIAKIKAAESAITQTDRNSIYMAYAGEKQGISVWWIVAIALLFALLVTFIILSVIRIKRMRKENETDKMTDIETGIGNLQFFIYHFKYTIADVSRNLYHMAYIAIDSSYLRAYHGDSSFEEVLKYTASVLSEHTGDREISARVTENGFAFAYQATNTQEAKKRIEEIVNKLNNFENMREKNNKIVFHAANYNLASNDKNCEILLFNLRKNCNKIYGSDKQIIYCDAYSMNTVQEEKRITESILKGFEKNEFKMYLQFIVDNKTKKITSAEALSRWDSFDNGLITPAKYIENMENSGLISRHDLYMFELACRQLEKWSKTEFKNISISCNFTRISLSEENFIDKLKVIADSYNFDKSLLAIEITEDAIEKDREIATENVRLCKEFGFKIYLDDLGSGYTSLSNLCDYPIDVVKIDRDILLKADASRGKNLFSGIIALAHSMNISVICEGVETEEQDALVSASDCDYIQGWRYSRAFPLEECEAFLNDKRI